MSTHNLGCRIAQLALWAAICCTLPARVGAQCPPLAGGKPQPSVASSPQFFDEPTFTVAGVTDTTNFGAHTSAMAVPAQTIAKQIDSLKQQPSAETKTAAASQPNSDDYESQYRAALGYAQAGQYERSRELATKLIETHETPDAHHLLGEVDEKLGDPVGAVKHYERAVELQSSEGNLFDWGAELLAHGAFEPAIQVFGKGTRLFPKSGRMLVGLGAASYARGAYQQSGESLCKAADLQPRDTSPYYLLEKLETVDRAQSAAILERMARLAQLEPENALANYYYGLSLWDERTSAGDKRAADAESALKKAVSLDPKLAPAQLQLAILYAERKEFANAIPAYMQAIQADPRLDAAHYRLAQAYRATGEKAKADQETELYQKLASENAGKAERERHAVQQFVYTLRQPDSTRSK